MSEPAITEWCQPSQNANPAKRQLSLDSFCVAGVPGLSRKSSQSSPLLPITNQQKRPVGRPRKRLRTEVEFRPEDHELFLWVAVKKEQEDKAVAFLSAFFSIAVRPQTAQEAMKPRKVRRRYTDGHCFDVLELLNLYSIRKVEKLTGIPKSTILDIKKRAERGEVYHQKKTQIPNKKGGGRPLSYPPELDDEL